jgi:hypothetical protein
VAARAEIGLMPVRLEKSGSACPQADDTGQSIAFGTRDRPLT